MNYKAPEKNVDSLHVIFPLDKAEIHYSYTTVYFRIMLVVQYWSHTLQMEIGSYYHLNIPMSDVCFYIYPFET